MFPFRSESQRALGREIDAECGDRITNRNFLFFSLDRLLRLLQRGSGAERLFGGGAGETAAGPYSHE